MLANERVISRIIKDVEDGCLSHAYLVTGEKGMGKKSLARIMCLHTFCTGNHRPCGTCPDCKKVLSQNHPDVIFVTHEKPDVIRVDEIREQVCDTVSIRPYEGKRKFIIIDEAEKMPPQAQNALLKTLEEPPEFVTILLLAADEKALLDTIRSRCVKIKPEPVKENLIVSYLEKECGAGPEEALMCAAFAKGNTGLARVLCKDEDFRKLYRDTVNFCRNVSAMDAGSIAEFARSLVTEGADLKDLLSLLTLWYRDVLCGSDTFKNEASALRAQAARLPAEKVSEILQEIDKAGNRLSANVNKELVLELLFLKIREAG